MTKIEVIDNEAIFNDGQVAIWFNGWIVGWKDVAVF